MQESRKNVVELNQFGRSRSTAGSYGSNLLNACGEMAAAHLADAVSKTLDKAADELLELTDRVTGYEMRRLYDEAREFARDKQDIVETEFKHQFYQRYKRECRREKNRIATQSSLDSAQLSLMDPDDLEESLAAGTVANAINNVCGEELFGLSKRMGVLLDDPELQFGENPLSPEVIGDVVTVVLKEQGLPFKTRLILIPLINKSLPMRIREIYQDLNRFLVEKDVLPTIRVGVRKHEPAPASAPASEKTAASGMDEDESRDLLAVLHRLMAAGQISPGAQAGPGTAPANIAMPANMASLLSGAPSSGAVADSAPAPAEAMPAVMQTLTRLQKGQTEAIAGAGFDATRLGSGQFNILREIKDTGVTGGMAQMDVMTLDIVALVFDYILDDQRIPDALKALIGRLQIPVLKVAMLDRNFFSQKSHPARRLLDTLAEASMGWDEGEGHESGLYKKVDDLVQRILNQFDEQVDIFSQVLEEFLQYQTEEKQRIDEITGKSAQVIHSREQTAIARIVAHDEVQNHLFDQPMTEFIRAFLFGPWERHLTAVYARSGEGSAEWNQAVATMDDLIWSVKPKTAAQERKRLVELLPSLLKRLDGELHNLGISSEVKDQFFTGLVKCHAEAVRAGLRDLSEETALPTIPPTEFPTEPAEEVTAEAASQDFEAIPALTDTVELDPALLQEIAAEPEERTLVEEITIGDVGWLSRGRDEPEQDQHDIQVKQLKRGTWIEFRQDDGTPARAKLAWISPLKGIYLFTNRLGQRAMSINGEGLAAKFRDGQIQIIDNVPLMERAVNSLLEKLQQNAA